MSGIGHVQSGMTRALLPVKGNGPHVHFVRAKDGVFGVALCGREGPPDGYGIPRFRRVHGTGKSRGRAWCNTCHAESCREPSRIDWT